MNNLDNSCLSDQLMVRERAPEASEYEAAMDVAGEVFKLVETHGTPPEPKTYGVWYTYVSRVDDKIKERIDVVVENGGVLSSYDIDQIHQEYLCPGGHTGREDLGFDHELDAIMGLVQSYLESSENYSGSLTSTIKELSDTAKPAQIRRTVELLIAENENMRTEADNLNLSLKQSKVQIQEMQQNLAEARETGLRDPLTNLANRRKFEATLAKEITEAHSEGTPLCLVMGDIDHFKKVNDTYGHVVGDGVLKYVASLLTRNVKGRDAVARYGGEEFVIVLPGTKVRNAKTVIDQIRGQLESTNLVLTESNQPLGKITASFGISELREGEDSQQLLRRADAKLYEAKNAGRNCIACDDDLAD